MFGGKKRHFKARLHNVQQAIWDLEFNRAKLKMLREQMRQQYDRVKETSLGAQAGLEAEKSKEAPDQSTIDNYTKLIERYTPDLEYLTKQMEGLDQAIDSEALDSKGNPMGMSQKIEAARAMKGMLKEYLSTL